MNTWSVLLMYLSIELPHKFLEILFMKSDKLKQIFVKLCCCKLNIHIDVMIFFLFILKSKLQKFLIKILP